MGGGGGGTQTTNSTQTVNTGPWVDQAPHLKDIFNEAGGLYSGGPAKYFPTSTVAGMDPAQTAGLQQIINRGLAGSPLTPAANDTALKTIQGGFLDPSSNPYLKSTYDAAADSVVRNYQTATAPNTDGAMVAAGRYGSGAYQNLREGNERALGTSLNNLATNIYGGNYQAERDRQQAQTNNTGALIQAGYLDPTAAINAGGALQGQKQNEINADKARWDYEQNKYWENLAKYYGIVGANSWGQNGTTQMQGTTTVPQTSNPLGQILGGALSAASVAGGLGWKPFG